MAPEFLNGSSTKVSEKVDVFSLRIAMWEILTGNEPYANMNCGAIIASAQLANYVGAHHKAGTSKSVVHGGAIKMVIAGSPCNDAEKVEQWRFHILQFVTLVSIVLEFNWQSRVMGILSKKLLFISCSASFITSGW